MKETYHTRADRDTYMCELALRYVDRDALLILECPKPAGSKKKRAVWEHACYFWPLPETAGSEKKQIGLGGCTFGFLFYTHKCQASLSCRKSSKGASKSAANSALRKTYDATQTGAVKNDGHDQL